MSSSGSVFSETLQTITHTKLEELSKERAAFEEQRSVLLSKVQSDEDPLTTLLSLVDGVKVCFGVRTESLKNKDDGRLGRAIYGGTTNARLETDLRNLDRFLDQARYDPSIASKTVKEWEDCLLKYLETQSLKYKYADLYGKLVTEWLSTESSKSTSSDQDVDMAESFEEIPGGKKLESRAEWERSVFEPASVDVDMLDNYLGTLFQNKDSEDKGLYKAVKALREKMQEFEREVATPGQFSTHSLRWVISGLLNSDLLTNEKRAVLRDFEKNNIILAEIADVLNMRMSRLDSWTWGTEVPIEQRRKLNQEYNIYMQEDLLQAIFLQYIGIQWSVAFKGALKEFRRDKSAWKTIRSQIPKLDKKRREYYLGGHQSLAPSVQTQRRSTHRKDYFLFQLLDHANQHFEIPDGEEEADFEVFVAEAAEDAEAEEVRPRKRTMQSARKSTGGNAPRRQLAEEEYTAYACYRMDMQSESDDDSETAYRSEDDRQSKNPITVKQGLLHLLSTEIAVNTRLHGELTCLHSIFDQWNPSLPHATILAVLAFFGVSEKWQAFFKKFLQAPLKFVDEESAEPRIRQRGTPGSHALSDVFGEVILFGLDFAINQRTDGALLYRVHDDFWFWSPDQGKVVKAWNCATEFAKTMGVTLNNTKTGTVRITSKDSNIDSRLPKGQIRWGFLYLDSTSGRFEIDQSMVDSHVTELRSQLQSKSKSIFDWISAWNAYAATFFTSNFGKAANCFGREHVDMMLATHRRIQESIFQGSSVTESLKGSIRDRFGVGDVPDGFLYFPIELGGLGLKSPFVSLLQIRNSVRKNPFDLLDEFEEGERDAYLLAKKAFEKGELDDKHDEAKWKPAQGADEFMAFDEYTQYREEYANKNLTTPLLATYNALLQKPTEESIDVTVQLKQAIDQLRGQSNLKGITHSWQEMEPYWKWVAQLYGPEMVERFGGLNVVDPRLLPIGMVSLFRDKRIKWQG